MAMSDPGQATTTQTTSPYGKATPLLNSGLSDALSLYKKKQLNPYTPMSTATKDTMASMNNFAMGVRPTLNNALNVFSGMSNGSGDISSSPQSQIATKAMGPSYAEQNLGGVARGDMINQTDPNFERMLSSAKDSAATAARMSAGGMGRYGGDFAQTEVGRTVGDLEATQRYQRLQDERTRQVEANSLMDSMRQNGLGIGLNATNSASSIDAANQERRMEGAAGVPGAYQAALDPYRTQLDNKAALTADQAAKAGTGGMNLAALMQLLNGASGFGTTSGSTKQPSNTAGMIGGGALTLASLLSQL